MLHLRKDSRTALSHLSRIPLHDTQVRAHCPRQITLIDNQQITPCDAWSPLPRHLVPACDINDIDNKVRQLARVIGREVIPPALNEE